MTWFSHPRTHRIALLIVIAGLIGVDLATTSGNSLRSTAIPVSQLKADGIPANYSTTVAMVRSDDSGLSQPAPLTADISREQIIDMVYKVLDTDGGLLPLLHEGATVLMKINIADLEDPNNPAHRGAHTDCRVVEGIIRWMNERGPSGLHYQVAEGSASFIPSEFAGSKYVGNAKPVDGFALAGQNYRLMQQRLANDGIPVDIVDLNIGPVSDPLGVLHYYPVPEFLDFPVANGYWLHDALMTADVYIDVPVMKTHTPQITVCLKNHIGVAPGAKYGYYKGLGGPNPGDPKLHVNYPNENSVEREIIDLAAIARPDYNVVDAVMCKEKAKYPGDPQVRRNMVLAGRDMVAVDTICAELMGYNPDNVPHLVLAAREGLGTMNPEQITYLAEYSVEDSMYYFERPPKGSQSGRGHFGMSNRVWLLNAVDGNNIDTPYLGGPDAEAIGIPGTNGWSEPIQFSDDYIDIEAYYGLSSNKIYYAFCWVDVPEDQTAELWISHDEACAVWLDGEQIYRSTKSYSSTVLPEAPSKDIQLKKGRSALLVKLLDTLDTAPFALNFCRKLPSALPPDMATYPDLTRTSNRNRYEGTRVLGLKFSPTEASHIENWREY